MHSFADSCEDSFSFSTFTGKLDTRPLLRKVRWDEFIQMLLVHDVRKRHDGKLWSPAIYDKKLERCTENVSAISAFVLDVDSAIDPAALERIWSAHGLEYLIHSTFNHCEAYPKWRAVFPLKRLIKVAEWPLTHRKLVRILGRNLADPACKDASRMYYLPACPPEREGQLFARRVPGEWLDPDQFETTEEDGQIRRLQPRVCTPSKSGELVFVVNPGPVDFQRLADGEVEDGLKHVTFRNAIFKARKLGWAKKAIIAVIESAVEHIDDSRFSMSKERELSKWLKDIEDVWERFKPEPGASLPVIETNNRQLRDIGDDAFSALLASNNPPTVFVRAGGLGRVLADEKGRPRIATLDRASLRHVLSRCADWMHTGRRGIREISPPLDGVDDVLTRAEWDGIPPLDGVATAPVLAPDGQMRLTYGYCPSSRMFQVSHGEWPTWAGDAHSASQWLAEEVLGDFPFESCSDKAYALSLMLLPFVRPSISGQTPLHLVDAPVQGTGKSLLVRVCCFPFLGREVSASSAPAKDEAEWRKRITSVLQEGAPIVFIDNVSQRLDSDALASALTAPEWKDRVLGSSAIANLPMRCTWVATSNNGVLSTDLCRRTIRIRLDANLERPWQRQDFRHPHIIDFCTHNRARIVSAVVCIVTSWVHDGRPLYEGRLLGSFEDWARVMGGILGHAGVDGFLMNLHEMMAETNPEEEAWRGFIDSWWIRNRSDPVKASDLYDLALENDTISGLLGSGNEHSQKVRLGQLLRQRSGRVISGLRIEAREKKQNSQRYGLRDVRESGESGESFSSSDQPLASHVSPCTGLQKTHETHDTHRVTVKESFCKENADRQDG